MSTPTQGALHDMLQAWPTLLVEPHRLDLGEVKWCMAWIDTQSDLPTKHSSYGYKHVVEYWLRKHDLAENSYISEGSFICAALLSGYTPFVLDPESERPNVYFSKRDRLPRLWRVYAVTDGRTLYWRSARQMHWYPELQGEVK